MTISLASAPKIVATDSAADRATDAALATATVKLAADKKTKASPDTLRADQNAVTVAAKAAQKADAAAKTDGKIDVKA